MFSIIYKKGLNADKSKMEFDHPLTFFKANEMLMDAVSRYKQTGQSMRISYKILDMESGEGIFNSKIVIDSDIESLFQLIKENSNAPRIVIDYVIKVENKEIIEEEFTSFNDHAEEKAKLEQLKAEKNNILQQLKKDEKERELRDLEFQKKMKEMEEEKKALEKALQLKEKEDAVKESERIESIRLLEEKKYKAMKLMEEKRILDKKKKEEHEMRLSQVESETKKAEIELASFETELEMKALERKKELQELEEKRVELNRQVSVLKAEEDKKGIKHEQRKLTAKKKVQEVDIKSVKGRSKHFVRFIPKNTLNNKNNDFKQLDKYHSKHIFSSNEINSTLYQTIPSKIVVVGSLYRGAGSTLLSTNLARMIGERGVDVAYVEHPLIKPYMFDYLQIHASVNEEKEYFDVAREIKAHGLVRSKQQEWVQHKVKWHVIDSRKPPLTSFSYENMLVLSHAIHTSVLVIDISNRWLDPEIQKFLYLADYIYLCIEPDPIKYDWSLFNYGAEQVQEKMIMDFLNDDKKLAEYDLINMKYIKGIEFKAWNEMLQKKPLVKIPYINYEDIQRAVYKSTLLYDLNQEYYLMLEDKLRPLLKVIPKDFQDVRKKEGNILTKIFRKY